MVAEVENSYTGQFLKHVLGERKTEGGEPSGDGAKARKERKKKEAAVV